MRTPVLILAVAVLAAITCAAQDSTSAMKERIVAAKPKDQPKLYVELMSAQLLEIGALYTNGEDAKAQAMVKDLVTTVESTVNTSISTRKHMKQSEIAIRKLLVRLNDMERSLSFDQRPPIKDAIERIEVHQTKLLHAVFER